MGVSSTTDDDVLSETYDRAFRPLFEDSVNLLLAAEQSDKSEFQNAFARSSALCSMLLPEVCANLCIETLGLESSVFAEIDRLSPLAKFDFYLRTSARGKKVERGSSHVQVMQELKRLRDSFVHPKKHKVEWSPPASDGTQWGTSKKSDILSISLNPSMWAVDDAIIAMRGVHQFLNHLFAETCRFTPSRVTGLLFSDQLTFRLVRPNVYYYRADFYTALQRWKIDTSYFRIGKL